MRLIVDTFSYCAANLPNWNTISISGYHIREAGSTAVQEIAFTLANGIAYVEAAIAAGMDIDAFAPRLSFFWNAHNNLFEEVAKYRAARRMWARIMTERFGAKDPRSKMLRFHTQTGGSTLTAQQPENNIVRVTLQSLAAALGGTQSLHTNGFDEALGLPTTRAAKIALRTQQIVGFESGVADTVDPLAGSYFVESLTDEVERAANEYLDRIDALGGAVAAIEARFMQDEIESAAYSFAKAVDSGEKVVVGREPVHRCRERAGRGLPDRHHAAADPDRPHEVGPGGPGPVGGRRRALRDRRDGARGGQPPGPDEGGPGCHGHPGRGGRRPAWRVRGLPTGGMTMAGEAGAVPGAGDDGGGRGRRAEQNGYRFWPLFDLVVRTPRLEIRLPREDEFGALLAVDRRGDPRPGHHALHDAVHRPALARARTGVRPVVVAPAGRWTAEKWNLTGAVFVDGQVVGVQDINAEHFATLRSVHTGSWLGLAHQGQGLGKEMRQAILHLAFAGLGAQEAHSGAFFDNAPSLATSRAVGYEPNGERSRPAATARRAWSTCASTGPRGRSAGVTTSRSSVWRAASTCSSAVRRLRPPPLTAPAPFRP